VRPSARAPFKPAIERFLFLWPAQLLHASPAAGGGPSGTNGFSARTGFKGAVPILLGAVASSEQDSRLAQRQAADDRDLAFQHEPRPDEDGQVATGAT
jgi:hypothetical protein